MELITQKFYAHQSAALSAPMKTPPSHSTHTSFPIIAVAVIGILATGFLLVSYYIFVIKCCLNWHRIDLLRRFSFSRRRRGEDPLTVYSPPPENRGLNEAQIRSIPIFKFQKVDKEEKVSDAKLCECAVCLNEFQEEEKLRIIPNCAHVFHIDCIDIWLQNNANCPLCRRSISATRPGVHFPALAPSPSPQDPDPFTGRDEDYVVIEIGSAEQGGIPSENPTSNELLHKNSQRKKGKKFSHVSSMGDECIDNRKKDEQFIVQPMRRSFSMDSAVDTHLYLAVEEILQQVNLNEGCSSSSNRGKRSFFSFGQVRGGSRSAVQPIGIEP
ncbi:hypothetical protein ACS0TY_014442 [Phlomoides rotata]